MKTEQIHINGLSGNQITFREGKARDEFIPKPMTIKGIIDAPYRYIQKQKNSFPFLSPAVGDVNDKVILAHLIVNREEMTITLIVDPKAEAPDTVVGKLELHEDFVKFGINSGTEYTTTGLAELVKMNRSFFKDRETAMSLVKELRSFKAKVDKQLEKTSDDKANYTLHKSQAVDSNIPDSFYLNVPVFKGQPARVFQVEINISPESLNCSLVSPEVNDYVSAEKNKIIDDQVKEIERVIPELCIIEL